MNHFCEISGTNSPVSAQNYCALYLFNLYLAYQKPWFAAGNGACWRMDGFDADIACIEVLKVHRKHYQSIGGSIVAAAIVIATLLGLDALRVARGMFVDQIATYLSKTKAEAKKIEAEADRILAEADRIDAESQALTPASETAAQVNVNSGSGNMKVSNKPIQYNVGGHA